jgi:hypothetical protein
MAGIQIFKEQALKNWQFLNLLIILEYEYRTEY